MRLAAAGKLFAPQSLDVAEVRRSGSAVSVVNSAFVNYAVFSEKIADEHRQSLASELGGRAGDYFAATTLNYQQDDISHHMVRELTWLRKDDRSALRTLIAGDYVATSGGVRPSTVVLGGISLTKHFALTPHYSTAPSLDLQGVATSPSEAEVYVNGYRVSRERLAPGEFTLQNIPAQTGYGMAEVVITDAYGREQVISENYYIAQQLLRKGLNEYNHSIGFLREDFSEKSFSYGDPVLISSFRRGLSDQHKIGRASCRERV